MNKIIKSPIENLGYGFIAKEFLPKGKDEYYLRNFQQKNGIVYRKLSAYEIEALVRNRNTSDDWNKILVSDSFNPELVKNCKFYGLVRMGKLEPFYLEFSNLRTPVGLYNSTIVSCDFGDNVAIDNVNYLGHYIIGNEVILVNVNEINTTPFAKFGNGIVKEGEAENIRIWLELCNENGGRSIIPFNGMLPGDAWLWTKYRNDDLLLEKFKLFTEKKFNKQRGYYGKIGDRTVVKNCKIIKDVWIGSDAYLKGANKIKNVTINSSENAKSQIGEGSEIVNGIVGFGCRIFYGVKAVRFIMASNSQLKYGARLINSYLGDNSTISCCEVLNSLIFPAHEQHHNNSFLCAATVMGQSNIAAGATIGSNHNSRSPDGEIVAGRGFWPGLCVSLKHNSKFASYSILAKGDYPNELNIPLPFSFVSNDVANDKLVVMPAYWFMYNMYALARNSWKYIDRDNRPEILQHIEYNFLAPDTVNEIFEAIRLLEIFTGKSYLKKQGKINSTEAENIEAGKAVLNGEITWEKDLEIVADGFENGKRKTVIIKAKESYLLYNELIEFYAITELLNWMERHQINTHEQLARHLPKTLKRNIWENLGGQLVPKTDLEKLIQKIHVGHIKDWAELHTFYQAQGKEYADKKTAHALACWEELTGKKLKALNKKQLAELLLKSLPTKEWMAKGIQSSRAKDYENPYRKMVYNTQDEMDAVLGKLNDNSFIKQETAALKLFKASVENLVKKL